MVCRPLRRTKPPGPAITADEMQRRILLLITSRNYQMFSYYLRTLIGYWRQYPVRIFWADQDNRVTFLSEVIRRMLLLQVEFFDVWFRPILILAERNWFVPEHIQMVWDGFVQYKYDTGIDIMLGRILQLRFTMSDTILECFDKEDSWYNGLLARIMNKFNNIPMGESREDDIELWFSLDDFQEIWDIFIKVRYDAGIEIMLNQLTEYRIVVTDTVIVCLENIKDAWCYNLLTKIIWKFNAMLVVGAPEDIEMSLETINNSITPDMLTRKVIDILMLIENPEKDLIDNTKSEEELAQLEFEFKRPKPVSIRETMFKWNPVKDLLNDCIKFDKWEMVFYFVSRYVILAFLKVENLVEWDSFDHKNLPILSKLIEKFAFKPDWSKLFDRFMDVEFNIECQDCGDEGSCEECVPNGYRAIWEFIKRFPDVVKLEFIKYRNDPFDTVMLEEDIKAIIEYSSIDVHTEVIKFIIESINDRKYLEQLNDSDVFTHLLRSHFGK